MSARVRLVSLSLGAEELLRDLAAREKIDPDIFASLVLENAIRERHESERRFAAAAARIA